MLRYLINQRRSPLSEGFSLPIAIITGFIIILGSLVLASRSSWSIFGNIFSSQSASAKEAAEVGMSQFLSELNKEQNRWLLVVRNNAEASESDCSGESSTCQEDPDFDKTGTDPLGDLWADRNASLTILELRQNPCIVTSSPPTAEQLPNYSRLDPNGANQDTSGNHQAYGKWFIDSSGNISSSSTNAKQSFRLVKVIRQPFGGQAKSPPVDINGDGKNDENDRYLSVWRDRTDTPTGVGKVTLVVEGQAYVNGKVISSVQLEKEFELTPKCCNAPFGGKHGNVNYSIQTTGDAAGSSICINKLGLGLLAGSAGTNTGEITVKGKSSDIEDESGAAVNPIYCLASALDSCSIDVKDPDIDVAIIDKKLPPPFSFCNPSGGIDANKNGTTADEVYGSNPCSSGDPPIGDLNSAYLDSLITAGSDFVSKSSDGKTYIINTSATSIPSFCKPSSASPNSEAALHCNIGSISYKNNQSIAFKTGGRPLRLYFPDSGTILDQEGNGQLLHCISYSDDTCTASNKTTDLSFFGSSTLAEGSQTVELNGTADTANMFFYFPIANVSLVGTASFTGVMWTNEIGSTGNPTWIIPSTGLTAVYKLMQWNPDGLFEPPFYDFVLRATNRFRWLGG